MLYSSFIYKHIYRYMYYICPIPDFHENSLPYILQWIMQELKNLYLYSIGNCIKTAVWSSHVFWVPLSLYSKSKPIPNFFESESINEKIALEYMYLISLCFKFQEIFIHVFLHPKKIYIHTILLKKKKFEFTSTITPRWDVA